MNGYLFRPIPSVQAAEKTPADRDRVIDAARAGSLLMVVIGHAFMGVVAWKSGAPRAGNILATYPWTQMVTWVLQIVPLFFFAGGAANAISWDKHVARGGAYSQWVWTRVERLLRPVWIYLFVMGVLAAVVSATVSARVSAPLLFLVTQLLWFLGSYIFVTGLTPLFRPSSKREGMRAVAVMILITALIDYLRFCAGWPKAIGLINFIVVWSISAYLGAMRGRGLLLQFSGRFFITVIIFNFAVNAALIYFGPWPLSLVGMPGEPVTNMAPPSLVLAFHSITWVCLISLANSRLTRLLQRPGIWRKVCAINLAAMTLYLWHLPVLVGLFWGSHLLGLDRPTRLDAYGYPLPDGWLYLAWSLPFWALFGVGVWAIVRLMWPFEHMRLPWWDGPPSARAPRSRVAAIVAGIGVFMVGASLLALAGTGLGGFPTRIIRYAGLPLNSAGAIALLALSGAMIRWAGGARRSDNHGVSKQLAE